MGTPIPVVCKNPKCGVVFITDGIVSIGSGGTFYFEECTTGPCPQCGGDGLIPSGHYTNSGSVIEFVPRSQSDVAILERALALVRDAISRDMSVSDFKKAAQEKTPELASLWKLMPSNQSEACGFLNLVLMAITVMLLAYQTFHTTPAPEIAVPKEITDAILASRPDSHAGSHKAPSKLFGKEKRPPKQ